MAGKLTITLTAALCLLLPVSAAARAPVLESLNAQRAAHGLPSGITENGDMSAGCNAHVNYMKLNNYFGHDEDATKPGYTEAGANAGLSSVLASAGWPDVNHNPFEFAPIHLAQILAPALSVTGFDDSGICVQTWPGYQRKGPEGMTFYSYPGNGTSGWRSQESTFESPFTPAEVLGLSNPTGPHIYLFPFGAGDYTLKLASATITGPEGVVDSRSVARGDGSKVANYLPPGGIIIPVKPLAETTRYTVASAWQIAAPSGAFSEAERVADMKRIWTLFSWTEAAQTAELVNYNKLDAASKYWYWDDVIKVCQKAASGTMPARPYNKILPADTPCRTVKTYNDERAFTTGKGDKKETTNPFDGTDEEEDVVAVQLSARGKGRKVVVKMAAHPAFQGQSVRFIFDFNRAGKAKKIKRKVLLADSSKLTLLSPFKSGRVRLKVTGRVAATDLYPSQSLSYRYSWRVR